MKHSPSYLIIAFFAVWALTVSCEKDISVGSGVTADNRNVFLKAFLTYEGEEFFEDSVYQHPVYPMSFVITDFRMVISNFFVETTEELFIDTTVFAVVKPNVIDYPVLKLSKGSYSGQVGFVSGIPLFQNFITVPQMFPENSPMREPILYRGLVPPVNGYNFLVIQGYVLIESGVPGVDSLTLPFKYELGHELFSIPNVNKNFSVANNTQASFGIRVDIDRIIEDFDLVIIDKIRSNPNDSADYQNARSLREALDSSIVFF